MSPQQGWTPVPDAAKAATPAGWTPVPGQDANARPTPGGPFANLDTQPSAIAQTGKYLGGELKGLGEAAKGAASGIGQTLSDVGSAVKGNPGGAYQAGQDLLGMGKGAYHMIADPLFGPAHSTEWFPKPANPLDNPVFTNPQAFGREVFNLAASVYAPEAPEKGIVGLQIAQGAIKPIERLHAHALGRLSEAMLETQKNIKAGLDTYAAHVDYEAKSISAADKASGMPPLDMRPVKDAFVKTATDMKAMDRENMPRLRQAEAILNQSAPKGTWEDLKTLRTGLGQTMSHGTPFEQKVIGAAYDEATNRLAARAADLGQTANWDHYNNLWTAYRNLRDNAGDKLLEPYLNDPTAFFAQLYDKKNALIHGDETGMLDKFDKYTNPLGIKGQGVGSAIQRTMNDVRPFQAALTKADGASFMGRMRAIGKHPVIGGLGGIVGMLAGRGLPGMEWLGGMMGASTAADFMDKINLAEALVKGRKFPEGRRLLEGATQEGVAPDPLQSTMQALEQAKKGVNVGATGLGPPRTRADVLNSVKELAPETPDEAAARRYKSAQIRQLKRGKS